MSAALSSVAPTIAHLRTIATPATDFRIMPFGVDAIDGRLGAGGLRAGALHEATAQSATMVDDAATTLFLASIAAREAAATGGLVLWASCRADLYAPALEQIGLPAAAVIHAQARGLGARALRLTALRVDGTEQVVGVGTSRPTREVSHLLRLLKLRIERIDPGMGLEQFWLVAPHTEPLDAVDLGAVLAGEALVRDPARLVDVIVGRIGGYAVYRLAPVESHVPERAVTRSDPVEMPGSWPAWKRPIRLFARPEPLARVMALMPDQPPRRFEWRGKTYKIVAGDGPERVHGEWWRRDAEIWAVRDYYRVEDEAGGRYWVFRRGDGFEDETGDLSWWMHGVFG